MNPVMIAGLSFVLVTLLTFLTAYLLLRFWPAVTAERLEGRGGSVRDASILRFDPELTSRWQRVASRIGHTLSSGDQARWLQFRQKLISAGIYDPRAVPIFLGAKVGLAAAGFLIYPFYGVTIARVLPNLLLISAALAGLGFFLPDLWLKQRARKRQEAIVHALPDVLDLLMVCVEAGMGFDAAVARIAAAEQGRRSPLHDELLRMHLEVRAGRPREEAMRDLGERTACRDVRRVVSAFTQAERLGTPLGRTLRVHAEAARVERRHRAEARAYLAPLKMIFPTAIFLMPAFIMIALAPALLTLIKLFQGLGGAPQ